MDDGAGAEDPLQLVVEIKGERQEDAKDKKATMETYWVPGVNSLVSWGRWAFAEFTEIYAMEEEFSARALEQFELMLGGALSNGSAGQTT